MINEFPNEVTSYSNNIATKQFKLKSRDFVTSILNFKSGLILRATSNLACVYRHQHIFKIYGTKKTFVYDDLGPRIYHSRETKENWKKINLKSFIITYSLQSDSCFFLPLRHIGRCAD